MFPGNFPLTFFMTNNLNANLYKSTHPQNYHFIYFKSFIKFTLFFNFHRYSFWHTYDWFKCCYCRSNLFSEKTYFLHKYFRACLKLESVSDSDKIGSKFLVFLLDNFCVTKFILRISFRALDRTFVN